MPSNFIFQNRGAPNEHLSVLSNPFAKYCKAAQKHTYMGIQSYNLCNPPQHTLATKSQDWLGLLHSSYKVGQIFSMTVLPSQWQSCCRVHLSILNSLSTHNASVGTGCSELGNIVMDRIDVWCSYITLLYHFLPVWRILFGLLFSL